MEALAQFILYVLLGSMGGKAKGLAIPLGSLSYPLIPKAADRLLTKFMTNPCPTLF